MATNDIIIVKLFGQEVGRIGLDESETRSSFQYNPEFLGSNTLQNIFPKTGILKRTEFVQLFSQFDNETFRGLPPQFADSLPDMFGSIILKAWLESKNRKGISVLEQLAYIGKRGMGALEYSPVVQLPKSATINLDEIIEVLKGVLNLKKESGQKELESQALINIFKIGTSAGGARPKILISENENTGEIIPGDLEYSNDYNHYLVKLALDEEAGYQREIVEYCYYQIISKTGIRIMDSKLIDDKHFATLRFDRQNGEKKHVLTASGLTGWDYKSSAHSSYENLFKLCSFLKIPHAQTEELFRRMIFNVIYGNIDDHLKNHSFVYSKESDSWQLSPAYDITFALNPLINITKPRRALSINGKRSDITFDDVSKIAQEFTIKNPMGVIREVVSYREELFELMRNYDVKRGTIEGIGRVVLNSLD